MSAIPGDLDTDSQPPMAVPLRHFVVGFGFLVAAAALRVGIALGVGVGLASVAHVHLLLVGWVCLTIAGAMTQFVPVWSGVTLHSRRLAVVQLWLLALGVTGLVVALLVGRLALLPVAGAVLAFGFWTLAYNVGRTLLAARPLDVTERHFLLALGFFVLVTLLGLVLALDFTRALLGVETIPRTRAVAAHATLAVFGGVLTTVFGALYQLATMFTQTELDRLDGALATFETVAFPVGVLTLAAGRLVAHTPLARVGGLLVVASVATVGVVLARRLHAARVPRTPMLTRYAVAAVGMVGWAVATLPRWLRNPLAVDARFGASFESLVLLVVGFVVLGTLYHVVPFVVWVHRYADRLGYEPVPMIDDLYADRVAAVDLVATVAGAGCLVAADWVLAPAWLDLAGSGLFLLGVLLCSANLLRVVRVHGDGVVPTLVGTAPSD
jgi:CBS domain-containing protein